MGKKRYSQLLVSPDKTDKLALPELRVLGGDDDASVYHAVHVRYFDSEKPVCPACMSNNTRVSKVIQRKFKDILPPTEKKPAIIDLFFAQRYYRCNNCKNRVFPEIIDFAERGCRYTNRLSDVLADGTLRASYEQVCKSYGVPASKTSVGVIMRRRLNHRQSLLPQLKTPRTLAVVEVFYYGDVYPVVLGMADGEVYFLDILADSSEDTYLQFFRLLDSKQVSCVYIDPIEQLNNAAHAAFPGIPIVVTDECVLRYVRDAFSEIIKKDGKRCGVQHKYDVMSKPEGYQSEYESKRIRAALKTRPRFRAAYLAYQELLQRFDAPWQPKTLIDWVNDMPTYLRDEITIQQKKYPEEEIDGAQQTPITEFDFVSEMVGVYQSQIDAYHALPQKAPPLYMAAVQGIVAAVQRMPHCIYDVLRARMLLNIESTTVTENGRPYRIGIRVDLLTESMNKITDDMKKEREDGYESEDSAGWD